MWDNLKIKAGRIGLWINCNPPAAAHVASGGTRYKEGQAEREKQEFTQNMQTFKGIQLLDQVPADKRQQHFSGCKTWPVFPRDNYKVPSWNKLNLSAVLKILPPPPTR